MNCFKRTYNIFFLLASVPFILMSCAQGDDESEIAKKITLTVSQGAIVLPNSLDDTINQTCTAGGVTGPRVRLRASITWDGTENLVPLVITISIKDSRLGGDFDGSLSVSDEDSESLAALFGITATDYIPPGTTASTSTCFLDYGGLPRPTQEVTGATQLEIPATVQMMGVARDAAGDDTPFVKIINTSVIYAAGSVPVGM